MDKYEQKALNLLKEAEATLDIRYVGLARNRNWEDESLRPLYDCTLSSKKGSYNFDFWGSIADGKTLQNSPNTEKAKKIKEGSIYDVLAALDDYEGTLDDFCVEFGYSSNCTKTVETYLAVQRQTEGLRQVFTAEQLEKLHEIY